MSDITPGTPVIWSECWTTHSGLVMRAERVVAVTDDHLAETAAGELVPLWLVQVYRVTDVPEVVLTDETNAREDRAGAYANAADDARAEGDYAYADDLDRAMAVALYGPEYA